MKKNEKRNNLDFTVLTMTALALALALTACGGGGGGSTASSSASVPVIPPVVVSTLVPNFATTVVAFAGYGLAQLSLDPSTSTSTGGSIAVYKVDWGDGQTSMSASNLPLTHTYTTGNGGNQQITLSITDNNGNTKSIQKVVSLPDRLYGNDGMVYVRVPITNQVIGLQTEIVVPPNPNPVGTLAVWPGLQPDPNSLTLNPVGFGVIQPIMVWGGIGCSFNTPAPTMYSSWWVEAYVWNDVNGCSGGDLMEVRPGDKLKLSMSLTGSIWNQTITNVTTSKQVSFSKDMQGQAQNQILFAIEEKGANTGAGLDHVTYTNTMITLAHPESGNWCNPTSMGYADIVVAPTISSDMKSCTLPNVTLTPGPNSFRT